jgi:hypothetical protein
MAEALRTTVLMPSTGQRAEHRITGLAARGSCRQGEQPRQECLMLVTLEVRDSAPRCPRRHTGSAAWTAPTQRPSAAAPHPADAFPGTGRAPLRLTP